MADVVVSCPLEEIPPAFSEHCVVVPGGAQILSLAVVADTGIDGSKTATNLLRPIGRCVVGHDYFDIGIGLIDQGLQSISEVVLTVENRQSDTDSGRSIRHLAIPCSSATDSATRLM